MSGDGFDLKRLAARGEYDCPLVGRGPEAAEHPAGRGFPQQRVLWLKLLAVPRLRNPATSDGRRPPGVKCLRATATCCCAVKSHRGTTGPRVRQAGRSPVPGTCLMQPVSSFETVGKAFSSPLGPQRCCSLQERKEAAPSRSGLALYGREEQQEGTRRPHVGQLATLRSQVRARWRA